jgi:hypothetical protein
MSRSKTAVLHLPNFGFQSKFAIFALALLPVTLWLLMHGYHGITEDGQIYAFQAYARLHPQLATDLYLQNTSQDQFTLFSPVYAWFIGWLGLESAARLLTLIFVVWFLAATHGFVRAVAGRDAAWLAVAFLLIAAGDYGGSGVFQILDPFLTARLPAEALIISALYCHARDMKRLGLILTLAALFIHPLMALPGVLMIIFLWLPLRLSIAVAIGGVLVTLALAVLEVHPAAFSTALTVMDPSWTDIVQERSQFLFLQLWSMRDWTLNARPFIYLAFTACAVTDRKVRKLCAAAALVGGAGLAVAFIGSLIGPVAIVVQGQAWRWVWIGVFVSVSLAPFTFLQVWRDERCGSICALSIVLGWTLPGVYGTACALLGLVLWMARAPTSARLSFLYRWGCAALGVAVVVWTLVKCWALVSAPIPALGRTPTLSAQVEGLFALKIPAMLLGALVWWGTSIRRAPRIPVALSVVLTAFSLLIFPAAFRQARTLGAASDVQEFADWESIIPPTGTVLVAPPRDVGAFVWFTLARPNYLVLDQSSGVVFSRATSLEVQRRSEVLLPLMDPDWKILTGLRESDGRRNKKTSTRPLTAENLVAVCADPQLGFVISPEKVGFDPVPHKQPGIWRDWNLYDCRKVRSARPAT